MKTLQWWFWRLTKHTWKCDVCKGGNKYRVASKDNVTMETLKYRHLINEHGMM